MKHSSYKNLTLLSGITKHLNVSFGKAKERDVNTPFNQEGKHSSLDEINFLSQVIEPGKGPSLEFSRQEHWSGMPFPSPAMRSWRTTTGE